MESFCKRAFENVTIPSMVQILFGAKLYWIFATKAPSKGRPLGSLARTVVGPARMVSITGLGFSRAAREALGSELYTNW